jgi:hypothetical protein
MSSSETDDWLLRIKSLGRPWYLGELKTGSSLPGFSTGECGDIEPKNYVRIHRSEQRSDRASSLDVSAELDSSY